MEDVTVRLEPGPMTGFSVDLDGETADGLLEMQDVGVWLDRLIRQAHRVGCRVIVHTVEPAFGAGVATRVAARMVRRTLEVYDSVEAHWT